MSACRTTPPTRERHCPVRDRARLGVVCALWLVLSGVAQAGEGEPGPVEPEGGRATVTTVVSGVIGYTRWPSPMAAIRVCAVGSGQGVDELLGQAALAPAKAGTRVRVVPGLVDAANQCDVIYVGRLTAAAAREILQRTVGHPVLTIGEGADFCSDGGMVCLQTDPAAARFAVNLDAVARSGLRVNPWVLSIARTQSASRK